MRPKIAGRVLRGRSLAKKDVNAAVRVPSNSNKKAPLRDLPPESFGKENIILDELEADAPCEGENVELTAILEHDFEAREGLSQLTPEKLALLQGEIFRNEQESIRCGRLSSCSDLRRQAPVRLWLLFELELLADGQLSFRALCYNNQVYKRIDPDWNVQRNITALEELPEGYEEFPIQQLLIPTIQVSRAMERPSIQTGDAPVHEKGPEHARMPSSFLAKRNLRSIFDQTPVKAEKILSQESTSSSENLLEEIAAPDDKKCTIFKKLSIMGALELPRLPGL